MENPQQEQTARPTQQYEGRNARDLNLVELAFFQAPQVDSKIDRTVAPPQSMDTRLAKAKANVEQLADTR